MTPAASVSGLYFSNPQASYFAVGKITKEQVWPTIHILKLLSLTLENVVSVHWIIWKKKKLTEWCPLGHPVLGPILCSLHILPGRHIGHRHGVSTLCWWHAVLPACLSHCSWHAFLHDWLCNWLPAYSKTNPTTCWFSTGTHQACCKGTLSLVLIVTQTYHQSSKLIFPKYSTIYLSFQRHRGPFRCLHLLTPGFLRQPLHQKSINWLQTVQTSAAKLFDSHCSSLRYIYIWPLSCMQASGSLRSSGRALLSALEAQLKTRGDRTFAVGAWKLWKLPEEIRSAESVTSFKSHRKAYCYWIILEFTLAILAACFLVLFVLFAYYFVESSFCDLFVKQRFIKKN